MKKPSTETFISIVFTQHEFDIIKKCIRLVSKHCSLHEIFEDADYAWEQEQDTDDEDFLYENRPTSQVEQKLKVYE